MIVDRTERQNLSMISLVNTADLLSFVFYDRKRIKDNQPPVIEAF